MVTRKFKDHPHAKAWILEHETGEKVLVSYSTPVVEINHEGWMKINTLENPATGKLSMTTIKHVGWFMRELGFTYQLAKALYYDHKEMNIYTGEVIDA